MVVLPVNPRADLPVGGRLRHFAHAWGHASRWVRRVVTNGLALRFSRPPRLRVIGRGPALDGVCRNLVDAYVAKNALHRTCRRRGMVSRIFAVPKHDGGHRLVFDLRSVNLLLSPLPTRFTGHQRLRQLLPVGSWMASLDIQDAYLHVPVHRSVRRYLCFVDADRCYEFHSLPFGLNLAPLVFTSVLRPVLLLLRQEGINVLAYLDDLIVWAPSAKSCERAVLRVTSVLQQHGFLINPKKSRPQPAQSLVWLGFRWDTTSGKARLSETNVGKISTQCKDVLARGQTTLTELQSLFGRLAFAAQLLPGVRYYKRSLTPLLRLLPKDGSPVPLPPAIRRLLDLCVSSPLLAEQGLFRDPHPEVVLWTDASSSGWGIHDDHGRALHGTWSPSQKVLHINLLELLAVLFAVRSRLVADGQCVAVYVDNVAAFYACLRQGSIRSASLHAVYGAVFRTLCRRSLVLLPRRIPGVRNVLADALSRSCPMPAEWEIDRRDFGMLLRWAGPFQVDLMATPFNTRLDCFVSPFPHPRATAVDALTLSWDRWTTAYLFPPASLLDRLLPRILAFQGRLVLVIGLRRRSARHVQILRSAKAVLPLRYPPSQLVGRHRHYAACSTSLTWTALLFSRESSVSVTERV